MTYFIRETNNSEEVTKFINFLKNEVGIFSANHVRHGYVDKILESYLDIIINFDAYKSFIVAWKIAIHDIENEQRKLKSRNKSSKHYSGNTKTDATLTNLYKLRTIIRNNLREKEYI